MRDRLSTIVLFTGLLLATGNASAELSDRELALLIGAANEAVRAEDFDLARNLYAGLLDMAERPVPEAVFNLACIDLAQSEHASARDRLRDVLQQTDNQTLLADAHYNLGHVAYAEARELESTDLRKAIDSLDASEQAFRRVLVFRPQNLDASRNIEIVQRLRDTYRKQLEEQEAQQEQQSDEQDQGEQQDEQPQDSQEQGEQQDGDQQQDQQQQGDQQQESQDGDQQQQDQGEQSGEQSGEQQGQDQQAQEDAQEQQGQQDGEAQDSDESESQQPGQRQEMREQEAAEQAQEQLRQLIAQILDKERREREARARVRAQQRAKTEKDW